MRSARLLPLLAFLLAAGAIQAQTAPAPSPAKPSPAAPTTPAPTTPAPTTPAPTTPAPTTPAPTSPAAAAPEQAPAATEAPEAPAQEPAKAAASSEGDGTSRFVVVDDKEPEPELIPDASDTLAGHFTLGAGAGLALPFGELEDGASESDAFDLSLLIGADVGYGVSRSIALGLWGQYLSYSADEDCVGCEGSGFAIGPFIRYHLVQGVRFDPWMLLGAGYRMTSIESPAGDDDYSGIEFAHVQLGGDWYPTANLGFGPFIGLDLGVYGDHPSDDRDSGLHWQFSSGLRVLFDAPGK